MPITVLIVVALLMMLIGVPIGISLSLGCLSVVALYGSTTLNYLAQCMYSGLNTFTLLAIPMFMLAGSLMEVGGLSKRLVNFAKSLVGNVTGGLGIVTILACLFFGAVSGSGPATCVAVGGIMIPHMVKAGYDRTFATGLDSTAAGLGVIIPPSIPMVVYGCTTGTSISDLFIAGFIPGIIVAVCLIVTCVIICHRRGYKGDSEAKFEWKTVLKSGWDAKWALLMPVIILGGIYGGIFTPTEAAVVAIVYAIIIGLFVYRELKPADIWKIFDNNTSFMGGIIMTFAPASGMGALFAVLGLPTLFTSFLFSISDNKAVILLVVNLFCIILGMLMDVNSAIIIFAPLFYTALVTNMGMSPVHMGIMLIINFCIGFVTPPVAPNLFVASSLTGISVTKIARQALPFMVGLFVALMIVTYWEAPVLLLGRLLA